MAPRKNHATVVVSLSNKGTTPAAGATTMHLLSQPFKTRSAALKRSKAVFPGFRGTDDERAVPYAGGFVALVRLAASNSIPVLGDVFEGAKGGAATRIQLF